MTSAVPVRALSVQVNGMLRRTPQRTSCNTMDSSEALETLMRHSTADACFKDAADLHAELEEYPRAIALYDKVASHSLTSALTKYSVKDYWLKSLLCVLASTVCGH